jgi:hypothetical protein
MPVVAIAGLILVGLYLLSRNQSAPGPIVVKTGPDPAAGSPVAAPPPVVIQQRAAAPLAAPTGPQVFNVQKPNSAAAALDALGKTFPSLVSGLSTIAVEQSRADVQKLQIQAQRIRERPNDLAAGPFAAGTADTVLRGGGNPLEVNVFAASDGRIYSVQDPSILALGAAAQSQAQAAFDQALSAGSNAQDNVEVM